MSTKENYLAIGGMIHDIGKLLHRYDDKRSHSISGYEYLKKNIHFVNDEILEQVKYHHANELKQGNLKANSLAYITYIADNIAAKSDRREKTDGGYGFSRDMPLNSIFNLLNGNKDKFNYPPESLEDDKPVVAENREFHYTPAYYKKQLDIICASLNSISLDTKYINSLLEILEATLSFIPSSTSKNEVPDISLYDHMKLTAGIGCCIYQYLVADNIMDYKKELFSNTKKFYDKNAFLIYSMEISGIQDFIYTISSEKALKNLRARSFYIEIMMEHIVDELLTELSLSRTNLLYIGGGQSYLLLPNTEKCKNILNHFEKITNKWFLDNFSTTLFLACGYGICNSNDLQNAHVGSYKLIFKNISKSIAYKKSSRYKKEEILNLNNNTILDSERECHICKRSDNLNINNECSICASLNTLSKYVQTSDFFSVTSSKDEENMIPLPNGKFLAYDDEKSLMHRMNTDNYVRSYTKNKLYTGKGISSKMWVGDYENGSDFETLAENSTGLKRLCVLRADIDNLGHTFTSGFKRKGTESEDYYTTISRTATLSRKLSIFFKQNINYILENGVFHLTNDTRESDKRNATIVYSGGDDIFIIGAWDDVIGASIDLRDNLEEYTQGTLTISAGIGIFPKKFPVSAMARQTGELLNLSKEYPNKNAITLFAEGHTYSWDEFISDVYYDKFCVIYDFFETSKERGKGFLYRLLDFMRNKEDKINLARFAYLLARLEPDKNADTKDLKKYKDFAKSMYKWIQDDEECRQAITAMYLYVYLDRNSDIHNSETE